MKVPILIKGGKTYIFNRYKNDPFVVGELIYKYLFEGKTHRDLDEEVFKVDRDKDNGFEAMNVLHYLGIKKEFKKEFKNIYKDCDPKEIIEVFKKLDSGYKQIAFFLENYLKLSKSTFSDKIENPGNQIFPKGVRNPLKQTLAITQFKRDIEVKNWILQQSKGICECCCKNAPFTDNENSPFLEIHHLKRLADGGSDTITNTIAVCPNCHRELHFGKNSEILKAKLYQKIARLKPEFNQ